MNKRDLEYNFGKKYGKEIDVVREGISIIEKIQNVIEVKGLDFLKSYFHLRISDIKGKKED